MDRDLIPDLLEAQREILIRLAERDSVDEVLRPIAALVRAHIPDALCSIMVLDDTDQTLKLLAAPGYTDEMIEGLNGLIPGPQAATCGTAFFTGEPVFVEDTRTDDRWLPFQDFATRFGVRSAWSIPLFEREGKQVLGTFGIGRPVPGLPNDAEHRILELGATAARLLLRARHEDRQREQQELLVKGLLEQCEDPIFVKDLDRRYVLVNHAEAHGLPFEPNEYIGLRDEDIYPPSTVKVMSSTDLEVLSTGQPLSYVGENDNPVLGRRVFHVRKAPLKDPRGDIVGVLGVARDITELRQSEQLRQRSKRLEDLGLLAGGIAHDFNNVLTAIQGNLDLAQLQPNGSALQAQAIEEASVATQQASDMVRGFLNSTKQNRNASTDVDLGELLRSAAAVVSHNLPARVRLRLDIPDDLPTLAGSTPQLQQLAMNLILNAVESIEAGEAGEIIASLRYAALPLPSLLLSIVDNGVGMDASTVESSTQPFFTTKEAGHGLGMSISRGVVGAHGGDLTVQSRPGEGTRVEARLPLKYVRDSSADLGFETLAGQRVLIVDDEPGVRSYTERALDLAGAQTTAVHDADHALAVLATLTRFDAMLLDLCLPGASGAELLSIVRDLCPDLPVLLMSGSHEPPTGVLERDGGRTRFIAKPFGPQDLQVEMSTLLDSQSSWKGASRTIPK